MHAWGVRMRLRTPILPQTRPRMWGTARSPWGPEPGGVTSSRWHWEATTAWGQPRALQARSLPCQDASSPWHVANLLPWGRSTVSGASEEGPHKGRRGGTGELPWLPRELLPSVCTRMAEAVMSVVTLK